MTFLETSDGDLGFFSQLAPELPGKYSLPRPHIDVPILQRCLPRRAHHRRKRPSARSPCLVDVVLFFFGDFRRAYYVGAPVHTKIWEATQRSTGK